MDKETSIKIINEALNIAIKNGCYNLVEVTNIVNALTFLNNEINAESTDN